MLNRLPIAFSRHVIVAGLAATLAAHALALHIPHSRFAFSPQQSKASPAAGLVVLAHQKHVEGDYAEAEVLLTRALEIDVKALGSDSPEIANILNNLAEAYREQGKYADAEQMYVRAINIDTKAYGRDSGELVHVLNNLGLLYGGEGRNTDAEALHLRALVIAPKVYGKDSMPVAITLNCLGSLYLGQGRYQDAEPLFRRSLEIRQKLQPPDHPDIGTALNNLATIYTGEGKYTDAEPLLERALSIDERSNGREHPVVAIDLNNLAQLKQNQGKLTDAERYYLQSLSIQEKVLPPDHPATTSTLADLSDLYYAQDNYQKAAPYFQRNIVSLERQFQYNFTFMSEQDRLRFLQIVSGRFPAYFSFCTKFYDKDPALAGAMYDVALWQKGLIASSIASLRSRIAHSGDKGTLDLLEQLAAKRAEIARLMSGAPMNTTESLAAIARLREQADEMERELAKRSDVVAERNRMASLTWRDVRNALAPGEAAIEFVRFGYFDGKKRTGAVKYVALIATPATRTSPALVSLGEADQLEISALQDYWHRVEGGPSASESGIEFYRKLWKPLESKLGGAKRVYISPDGLFNQISLAAVPSDDGRLLIEKYDLRIVLSTRDLMRQRTAASSRTAVLIGDPQFDLTEGEQRAVLAQGRRNSASQTTAQMVGGREPTGPGQGLRSQDQPGRALQRLAGTAEEVKSVAGLLSHAGWSVETFTGAEALEETVKGIKGVRVLHIATHGFFEPDQAQATSPRGLEDVMLRSGLYFAGANRVLTSGHAAAEMEDGVLTAYEATGLTLQGTDLVVLSACETGLGESANGEGVFGLRRALQEAGALTVLMSMWKVPDNETRQLMTLFYTKWLAGKDKPTALREAQLELRQDVMRRWQEDRPHDWAAFVLVSP
jgi:CHAT domain-containing protein/Tfp pilus assembly protein PilF